LSRDLSSTNLPRAVLTVNSCIKVRL
jgi:hypothetical protein